MYDIIIIGSGPAGLSSAVYAQREMLNSVVIEKDYMGTGQIAESARVDNYLGLYGESGFDLGDKFREHAEKLGAKIINAKVHSIVPENNYYRVNLKDQESLQTKTVIIATGTSPRKLGVEGESNYIGKGVSFCAVCDGAFYRKKTVAVVGGGDTALQDALLLSKIADKVFLIHRREEFRANKALVESVKNKENIELVLNAVPVSISGSQKVENIRVLQNGEEKDLSVNGIFVAVGSLPNNELVKELVNLDDRGYIVADESGKTSANGIFAAGDIRTKALRQVVTAVSDGANCVISAENYLLNNK